MTATDHDIAICGGGPVGLALALMLVQRGVPALRVAVIDARPLAQAVADPRSIALSWGSRQLLDGIHAWPAAVTAIHDIHVSRRGHFGRTLIRCEDYRLPALGYVTRYGALMTALATAIGKTGIAMLRPAAVERCTEEAAQVRLALADGRQLTADLMIAAEGGVFGEQAGKSLRRDYGQTAIVASVQVSAPLPARAFERFTNEGPLALLPQDEGYALVWCVQTATAAQLHSLSDMDFLARLQETFGTRLGRFTGVGTRVMYPLGLNAGTAATKRTIAIGNAAQTLHPVAGQGLNLGLRDAAVLARHVAADHGPLALQRFLADQRLDRSLTIRLTDTMARIFTHNVDRAPSQGLLGFSLGLLDLVAPAKRLLAEHMMFGAR